MKYNNITREQYEEVVKNCKSLRQVMLCLGICPEGGNYKSLKKKLAKYQIDTSHFTGAGWAKGSTFPSKQPIEYYLNNKTNISSHDLRLRLIKEGLFEHKCNKCNNKEWLNAPIPLELHHKDRRSF